MQKPKEIVKLKSYLDKEQKSANTQKIYCWLAGRFLNEYQNEMPSDAELDAFVANYLDKVASTSRNRGNVFIQTCNSVYSLLKHAMKKKIKKEVFDAAQEKFRNS